MVTWPIFGRPFVKRFTLCYRTVCVLSCPVLSCPVWNVGVLWPNGWMDKDETWHGGRPRPHCVRWGPSCPEKATAPIFGRCLLWPNGRHLSYCWALVLILRPPRHIFGRFMLNAWLHVRVINFRIYYYYYYYYYLERVNLGHYVHTRADWY